MNLGKIPSVHKRKLKYKVYQYANNAMLFAYWEIGITSCLIHSHTGIIYFFRFSISIY
jgi:hypothetical protein